MSEVQNTESHIVHMKKQIWITDSLKQEISDLSQKTELNYYVNEDEVHFNLSSCTLCVLKIFSKHCEFVNYLQLKEVSRTFFTTWNVCETHKSREFK